MQNHKYLDVSKWSEIMEHPIQDSTEIEGRVQSVLNEVKTRGDEALRQYTEQFDGITLTFLEVNPDEKLKGQFLNEDLKNAIIQAKSNISAFHEAQRENFTVIETMPGVKCWRRAVAIDSVGLYIPGGNAPLFSTVLMLGIPAVLAGCKEIILCTPPGKDGSIHPAILFAVELVGIHRIFKVGGAQAIAAMAYGTESIPKVNKIFGPGNQYVTIAKQLVNKQGVAIDLPAGPSEVLILCDETASPSFIAADLLAQAEHGHDSHCILVTTNNQLLEEVEQQINVQSQAFADNEHLFRSIKNFKLVLLDSLEDCVRFSNQYAPEHLIIATRQNNIIANQITNAGSVFLGNLTPVSVGDYASGTNHTLPTNGTAVSYSGVSLDSFVKKITYQELNKEGLNNIGPIVELMAQAEGLNAHSNAVTLRLSAIGKEL